MDKKTCWVLTGPTASGKTALSVRIAKAYDCEIICMDSMQIYRSMDIGTAKVTPEEMDGVPHHLVDIIEPEDNFTVADYCRLAEQTAEEIFSRGKRPLFVGGTGFYLRALRHPMPMGEVPGNDELRARLEKQAETEEGKLQLWHQLNETDPVTAQKLHVNDVRRVVRALEVNLLTGKSFSNQANESPEPKYHYRVVNLSMDRAVLYDRINRRVDQMMDMGLEQEVRMLLERGLTVQNQAMKAIGYKEMAAYLGGEYDLDKAVYEIKMGTRHYAKRQLTWMRREEDVLWVDPTCSDAFEQTAAWFQKGEE
ncbi:MAG: tRNA (adenosine(37)-N6)-dimethylallyltransferase MiaA [Clostridia bacterium]|nr:tRNA (adenosine(37)-N6)-dimethylallyltransferase MiaA [Clostridia bacterium]